jgi:hypothetical protein
MDDLLILVGTPLEKDAFKLISKALSEKNGLCAKWIRPNVTSIENKKYANALRIS